MKASRPTGRGARKKPANVLTSKDALPRRCQKGREDLSGPGTAEGALAVAAHLGVGLYRVSVRELSGAFSLSCSLSRRSPMWVRPASASEVRGRFKLVRLIVDKPLWLRDGGE